MKLEKLIDGVRFIPETPFEEECLRMIADHGIVKAQYHDNWDRKFPLEIIVHTHPWDRT